MFVKSDKPIGLATGIAKYTLLKSNFICKLKMLVEEIEGEWGGAATTKYFTGREPLLFFNIS